MSQLPPSETGGPPPAPTAPTAPASIAPRHAPRPPTIPPPPINIINQQGGFLRGVGSFITALTVLCCVFLVGLIIGIVMQSVAMAESAGAFVQESTYREGGGGRIAILPVEGVIDGTQAYFVHAAVDQILADQRIKAVVLRVNSGGGGVTASDQIWYEVNRLKDAKLPVVASFGSAAASGGYYISCAADEIIAEETCLTGSIGVIAQVMTFEGLVDKVGIEPITVVATNSPEKNIANDIYRSWDEQDREEVLMFLDAAYDIFGQRVTDGRGAKLGGPDTIARIANGSAYTAQQAKTLNLIDSIGYLDDAIAAAEKQARLTTGNAMVVRFDRHVGFFSSLPMLDSGAADSGDLLNADRVRSIVNELSSVEYMYLRR